MRPARFIFVFAVAVALLLPLGCAQKRVKPNVTYNDSRCSYERVLNNWTRHAERFEGLETDFLVDVTFWSRAMSEAYAGERARAEALPAERYQRLRKSLLAKHERLNRFRIVFYTIERRWNDLDDKPSSWKVYLIDRDGEQVEPLKIKRLKVEPESETIYFPQTDPWSRVYEVTFPKKGSDGEPLISEDDGRFGLMITGARARADLAWILD